MKNKFVVCVFNNNNINNAFEKSSAFFSISGGINESEMLRTFNCGLGGILVVEKEAQADVLRKLKADGAVVVGKVVDRWQGQWMCFGFVFKWLALYVG